MAFTSFEKIYITETLEKLMKKRRPPENVRHEADLGYKIDNQSVIIFEIVTRWDDKTQKTEVPVAKTTWVKTKQAWKIYWMRGNLKWHSYSPVPEVESISEFTKIVDEDKHSCFWG